MADSAGLRQLPAVHRLLAMAETQARFADVPATLTTQAIAAALARLRSAWQSGHMTPVQWQEAIATPSILQLARSLLDERLRPSLRPVLNLTGVVVHTNLGRAPLSARAVTAMRTVAQGYSNLEFDLATGGRGSRHSHLEQRLCRLTGAEAALVVNNNAAAVLLALRTLAEGFAAVVSRGELVEIGGSFRLPAIMRASGVTLVEVGATNKTRVDDYVAAHDSQTRLWLRVHTSNYRIVGFTSRPSLPALAAAAHANGVLLMEDLGSGALFDFSAAGIGDEPTIRHSLDAGVDIVTFSGDKLLGGAQAGIIAGRKDLVTAMKRNQLTRALRPDKLTLAALDATLASYEDSSLAAAEVPVVRMLTASPDSLQERAEALLSQWRRLWGERADVVLDVVADVSRVGGGALPLEELPTACLRLRPASGDEQSLLEALRVWPRVPIIGRIAASHVLLDVRTLLPGEDDLLLLGIAEALAGMAGGANAETRADADPHG